MNKFLLLFIFAFGSLGIKAQKVDSIFFHLYTDSLKKGRNNYINIDGKLSNGRWLPLTEKELKLSCSSAIFEGNELIIPEGFSEDKVTVKAILKSNPSIYKEIDIWIKQLPEPILPTRDGMVRDTTSPKKTTKVSKKKKQ